MDLTPYVETLRRELAVAAEAGGADARALAERLVAPLESALRLTLLNALSSAAEEITRDLAPGSVDLRLRGGEPDFVVTVPVADRQPEPVETGGAIEEPPGADDGAVARINFRLPEQLKTRVEEAAGRDGLSVNAWLVRAAAAGLDRGPRSSRTERSGGRAGQHYTGWAR